MPCRHRRLKVDGFKSIRTENDLISVGVIPELGGKIYSVFDKLSETEFIWKNPYVPYVRPGYGARYQQFDASGIDECIPTVEPCTYPEGAWKGIEIPDHGEVWSIPWRCRLLEKTSSRTALALEVHGIRFRYQLTKIIAVANRKSRVAIQYKLTNHSEEPMLFVWALHSLLNIDDRTRILFPDETRAIVTSSKNSRLLEDQEFAWPWATNGQGGSIDLSRIGAPDAGFADKIVTTAVSGRWCGLMNERTRMAIIFRFPSRTVTNVGVWINRGGWGNPGYPEHKNVALEPQVGWDRLDVGYGKYNQCGLLQPNGSQTWEVYIDVVRNVDRFSSAGR